MRLQINPVIKVVPVIKKDIPVIKEPAAGSAKAGGSDRPARGQRAAWPALPCREPLLSENSTGFPAPAWHL